MSEENAAWRFAAKQYLESLADAGVTELPRVELPQPVAAAPLESPRAAAPATVAGRRSAAAGREAVAATPIPRSAVSGGGAIAHAPAALPAAGDVPIEATRPYPASLEPASRDEALRILADEVAGCRRCPHLADKRRHTVFGEGSSQARVCFFGEAPGEEEDRSGRPFVGPAGQLLDKMITACTFERSEVYLLNSLKCRPPGNRNPNDGELSNCRNYWVSQLEVIRPEYIVCLGAFAVRSLLGSAGSIGKLRGSFHRYRESRVIATYHPSYLLRTPSAKKLVWDDLKMMLADMGIDPTRSR